jgi:folate-binding protein YgfZ
LRVIRNIGFALDEGSRSAENRTSPGLFQVIGAWRPLQKSLPERCKTVSNFDSMSIYEQVFGLLPAAGLGRREAAPFGLIEVAGPDAVEFVHRLCSQDVVGLEAERTVPAAFLSPKGKLLATAAVVRAGDRVGLEVPAEQIAAVAELLERYHFSEKLSIERRGDWVCAEILGRASARCGFEAEAGELGDRRAVCAAARHGVRWVRVHGPAATVAGFATEVPPLGDDLAECLRMLAGRVRVGVDTEESTLALEAGLDDHISTDKGCYVGQEIVARIHTYGHVNRRIALLEVEAALAIARGTPLCDEDGDPVGRLMSAVAIPGSARSLALGFVPEGLVEEPVPLRLGVADGPRVQLLPFSPA